MQTAAVHVARRYSLHGYCRRGSLCKVYESWDSPWYGKYFTQHAWWARRRWWWLSLSLSLSPTCAGSVSYTCAHNLSRVRALSFSIFLCRFFQTNLCCLYVVSVVCMLSLLFVCCLCCLYVVSVVCMRGGGLGSRPIFKKFHETYAPS